MFKFWAIRPRRTTRRDAAAEQTRPVKVKGRVLFTTRAFLDGPQWRRTQTRVVRAKCRADVCQGNILASVKPAAQVRQLDPQAEPIAARGPANWTGRHAMHHDQSDKLLDVALGR